MPHPIQLEGILAALAEASFPHLPEGAEYAHSFPAMVLRVSAQSGRRAVERDRRKLVGIDAGQGLIAIGDLVETGGEVLFCRRDGNSARADMQQMLDDIQARLPGPARGALYFSCLGRGRHQFGDNSEELRLIRDTLGDVPLAGFFANGEIFHNRLYGYTGVLTVFC